MITNKKYFYVCKQNHLMICQNPGRNKKDGSLNPPKGIKDVQCWTEQDSNVWFFPDGTTQKSAKEDYGRTELKINLKYDLERVKRIQEDKETGALSLFPDLDSYKHHKECRITDVPKLPESILSKFEKDTLGFCLTDFSGRTPEEVIDELTNIRNECIYIEELKKIINKYAYESWIESVKEKFFNDGKGLEVPFWRYAIDTEWKRSWKEEWAYRTSSFADRLSKGKEALPWWRAEAKAFLTIVKELSESDIELGDLTVFTSEEIAKRLGKKKESSI
jgi:hypothetical protein